MPKKHDTDKPAGAHFLNLNDDGSWPSVAITNAYLSDIRRAVERTAAAAEASLQEQGAISERQRQTVKVLERIDRRLAKQIKLR